MMWNLRMDDLFTVLLDWYLGLYIFAVPGLGAILRIFGHLPAWTAWPLAFVIVIAYRVISYLNDRDW